MDTGTVQLQAIRLEFGDEFKDTYARTQNYVKGLIGKPWWHSKKMLLNGEGPLSKMTEHCLIFEIEKGNRIEGYRAYTAYLTSEYGTSLSRLSKHADVQSLDGIPALVGDPTLLVETPHEDKVGELPEWLSAEQADFLFMHMKVGMPEAATMTGVSEEAAWSRYRAIKAKVRYHD